MEISSVFLFCDQKLSKVPVVLICGFFLQEKWKCKVVNKSNISKGERMDNLYCVKKNTGNVIVAIMYSRSDKKYHFVNLTKDHICECGFESIEAAIYDMELKRLNVELIDYFKIN